MTDADLRAAADAIVSRYMNLAGVLAADLAAIKAGIEGTLADSPDRDAVNEDLGKLGALADQMQAMADGAVPSTTATPIAATTDPSTVSVQPGAADDHLAEVGAAGALAPTTGTGATGAALPGSTAPGAMGATNLGQGSTGTAATLDNPAAEMNDGAGPAAGGAPGAAPAAAPTPTE